MKILNIMNHRSLATSIILGAVILLASACNKEQPANTASAIEANPPASTEADSDLVL